MTDLNLEYYFKGKNNKYYDSKYIVTILEEILDSKLSNIKNTINDLKIIVTKDEIIKFLDKRFEEENLVVKKRIEKRKLENKNFKKCIELGKISKEDIEEMCDDLIAQRYYFEPYTLEYFNRYSNILKNKALLLLDIIEKIKNKDFISIQNTIKELDIKINKNGNISKEDIIRLITPTIYIINKLRKTVLTANDLSTYLAFKTSMHSLLKADVFEWEIYPIKSLQVHSLYDINSYKECVPLSTNQVKKLKKKIERNIENNSKFIADLWD